MQGERGEVLTTVIVIVVGAVLLFIIPLMAISNTQDDISEVAVRSLVTEFLNEASLKEEITIKDYEAFLTKLYATGHTYDIQFEHKIRTVNPNKGGEDQTGENLYYSVFNEAVLENGVYTEGGIYKLKKDDYLILTVKNTDTTIAEQLMNFLYSIVGKDINKIVVIESTLIV